MAGIVNLDISAGGRENLAVRNGHLSGSILVANPLSWHLIGFGLLGSLAVLFSFFLFADYSRVQVVQGRISLDRGVPAVVASRAGTIETVSVRNGTHVKKGDLLVTVRTQLDLSGGQTANSRIETVLEEQKSRLAAQEAYLVDGAHAAVQRLNDQVQSLALELSALDAQIAEQRNLVGLAQANFDRTSEVAKSGFISRRDLENSEATLIQRRQQLAQLEQQRIAKKASLASTRRSIFETQASASGQIEAVRSSQSSIQRDLAQADIDAGYSLRATVDGVVTAVSARPGQAIKLGDQLLLIVPTGAKLKAELSVPTSSGAFLREGQTVKVAVDAYPYRTFGTLKGTISDISQATGPAGQSGEPSYFVQVELKQPFITAFGASQPLLPGMTLSARIITDRRTLFEWLFEPLYAVKNR